MNRLQIQKGIYLQNLNETKATKRKIKMIFIEGFVYVTGPFIRNFFFGLLLRLLLEVICKGIQLLADRFILQPNLPNPAPAA